MAKLNFLKAGGLSNALPELTHDCNLGAAFELREIDNADWGMSPLQIWCCEGKEIPKYRSEFCLMGYSPGAVCIGCRRRKPRVFRGDREKRKM